MCTGQSKHLRRISRLSKLAGVGLIDWVRPATIEAPAAHVMRDLGGFRGPVWMLALITGMKSLGLLLVIVFGSSQAVPAQVVDLIVSVLITLVLVNPWHMVPNWFLHASVSLGAFFILWLLLAANNRGNVIGNALTLVVLVVYVAMWFPRHQVQLHVMSLLAASAIGMFRTMERHEAIAIWGPTALTAVLLSMMLRSLVLRIQHLALRDELTDAVSRTGLRGVIERHTTTESEPANAVVVIDLDDFKRVNDEQGHQAGDSLLRQVVDLLRARLRPNDSVVRTGGDEFMVLMPATSLDAAAKAIARVIADFPIGFSHGIAEWRSDADFDRATAIADAAMYECKAARRKAASDQS